MTRSKRSKPPPKKTQAELAPIGNPKHPRGPRSDKYSRLISRFYETVITMIALGHIRGPRTPPVASEGRPHRRFLDSLAFLCDYEKGGSTVTAIGLEERVDAYVFWVASNTDVSSNILQFVKHIIRELTELTSLPERQQEDRAQQFTRMCTDFAGKRIKKEAKILHREALKCCTYLKSQKTRSAADLENWLENLQGLEGMALCQHAYHTRKSDFMKDIERRAQEPRYKTSELDKHRWFATVKHQIGRLAHHVRAPKHLIEDFPRLRHLFDLFSVKAVPFLQSVLPPVPDSMTTLDGIVKRMLPAEDSNLEQYQAALADMDKTIHISDRLIQEYKHPNFRPQVHAELQILEHFYKEKLKYLDEDRFIACSKPACMCCELYIRHHPSNCNVTASHQKLYRNWGPPLLPAGIDDPGYVLQRDTLNLTIKSLRVDALDQIIKKRGPNPFHADSHTGITKSVDIEPDHTEDSLESQLQSLSLNSDYNSIERYFQESIDTSGRRSPVVSESPTVVSTSALSATSESLGFSSVLGDSSEEDGYSGGVSLGDSYGEQG